MRILISGSSGLIGTALKQQWSSNGHEVRTLVRRAPKTSLEFGWDPIDGTMDPAALAGVDAVVNLSGESLGRQLWTSGFKERLYSSRIASTQTLVEAMRAAATPPAVFLSQSATGFYGTHTQDAATEATPVGQNSFLADLCRVWETTAQQAPPETRTVLMRTGVVLSPRGGALAKLLLPLRVGLGGPLGSGKQWWPWITLADQVSAVDYLLTAPISGPVNLCSPEPATMGEIVKELGKALHRPTIAQVPEFVLRTALREMASELLLTSTLATPSVLVEHGFTFQHPDARTAAQWLVRGLTRS